jgi:hypothetical protein
MCNLEKLFNRFMGLKQHVQSLAAVVQNPMDLSEADLDEWESSQVANFNKELEQLVKDVRAYYSAK